MRLCEEAAAEEVCDGVEARLAGPHPVQLPPPRPATSHARVTTQPPPPQQQQQQKRRSSSSRSGGGGGGGGGGVCRGVWCVAARSGDGAGPALLACLLRIGVLGAPLAPREARELLLTAAARKHVELVEALLGAVDAEVAGEVLGPPAHARGPLLGRRGTGPLHAAVGGADLARELVVRSIFKHGSGAAGEGAALRFAAQLASLANVLRERLPRPETRAPTRAVAALLAGSCLAIAAQEEDEGEDGINANPDDVRLPSRPGTVTVFIRAERRPGGDCKGDGALLVTAPLAPLKALVNSASALLARLVLRAAEAARPGGGLVLDMLNARDEAGRTALHLAARESNAAVARVLLRAHGRAAQRAAPSPPLRELLAARDLAGRTAADTACAANNEALARELAPDAAAVCSGAEEEEEEEEEEGAEGGEADDVIGDGGWGLDGELELRAATAAQERAVCDIAELSRAAAMRMTPATFLEHFFLRGRPVVLRGLARGWPQRAGRWTRAGLLAEAQRLPFLNLSGLSIPFACVFGCPGVAADKGRASLRSHVLALGRGANSSSGADEPPPYIFEAPGAEAAQLFRDLPLLPALVEARVPLGGDYSGAAGFLAVRPLQSSGPEGSAPPMHPGAVTPQFFLGGAGTGAPLHFHEAAVNVLAFGRKDWLLLPPSLAAFSTQPARRLFAGPPPPGALRCTQMAGDIVFVPEAWAHATLNTRTSVGHALELQLFLEVQ